MHVKERPQRFIAQQWCVAKQHKYGRDINRDMWQRDLDCMGCSLLRYLGGENVGVTERTHHGIGAMPDDDDGRHRVQRLGCPKRVGDERPPAEFMERFGERGSHPRSRTGREDHHGERWSGFVSGMSGGEGHEAHSHHGGAVRAPWRVPAWLAD